MLTKIYIEKDGLNDGTPQGASELNDLLGLYGLKGEPGEIYRLTIDFDTNGEIPPNLTFRLPQNMLANGLVCEGLSIETNGNTVIHASMWRKYANGCDTIR